MLAVSACQMSCCTRSVLETLRFVPKSSILDLCVCICSKQRLQHVLNDCCHMVVVVEVVALPSFHPSWACRSSVFLGNRGFCRYSIFLWIALYASGCLMDKTKVDLLSLPRKSFTSTWILVLLNVSDDRGGCVMLLCDSDAEE